MVETRSMFPKGTPIRRVIDYATHEFFSKGIKTVTMDDIAKGLQMSKRTLYQLFADKEQLIIACMEVISEQEHELVQQYQKANYNVLEIFLRVIEWRMQHMKDTSLQYILDVARYKPVREYKQLVYSQAITRTEEIFKIGVQQGLFRNDVNVRLLMKCLFNGNEQLSSTLINEFTLQECFINIGLFHLRGCCTSKGIELIDKFLDDYRKDSTDK